MGTEQYTINQDSANPISNLSGNVPLADGDYYAISRHSNGQAVSYKISYSELIKRIVSDISARFNFKSMAFCDTYNFSEFDHQHGYSYVNCYSEYKNGTGQSCIMTVTINDDMNTRQLSVFSPSLPSAPPPREPSIGEVRFLAKTQTVAQYDERYRQQCGTPNLTIWTAINNGTFDGWVYPDGSEYSRIQGRYDFSRAYQAYNGSNGRFKVPVLSNFMRLNPGIQCQNALQVIPGQTGISSHNHEFKSGSQAQDLARQMRIRGIVRMEQTPQYGDSQNYFRGASNQTGYAQYITCNQECELDFSDQNVNIFYDADQTKETYPDCWITPIQIYIGGVLRS